MVEGESGILAISPDPERPLYEPSKRRLTWPNGAVAAADSSQWDGEFVSVFLQRRVRKLSVPPRLAK
jgi:phage terminase large subunit-like protein